MRANSLKPRPPFAAFRCAALLCLSCVLPCPAQPPARDRSFAQEVQHGIDRGLAFLKSNQHSNGWWSTAEAPAVTALALTAFQGDPSGRYTNAPPPAFLQRGYNWLLSCAQPDGGIHRSNLVTYNTSIAMMALLAAGNPDYEPVLRRARAFLVGLQRDFGQQGKLDDVFDGGIGYGSKYEHSDMGNTLAALEALYYSKHLARDQPNARDLNWAAAIAFLQNCQNLPSYNKQSWASDDPSHKGGFVYYPGHSMAGAETNAAGRVALRSYGSISYGGLLSYIYADLKRDDPRVIAVFDWLRAHYSLEENPGLGKEGLYYYLHTMTKALTIVRSDELPLKDGRRIHWRKEVAMKLLNLQARDGSWANDNARWWEKDPTLVTAYAVLSLEMIWRGLWNRPAGKDSFLPIAGRGCLMSPPMNVIWDKLAKVVLFFLFLAGVSAVFFWYLPLIEQNQRYRKELLALDTRLAEQERWGRQLRTSIESMHTDPKAVERLAREKLGWARTNEMIIRFEGPAQR